jgi:predicted TIM-barrel fold metal-dependent hydrolase
VLNHHGGTGSPDYGPWKISLPIRLLETGFYSTRSYPHLLMSGVFERFPKLKYIVTESGCAWVPQTLKNLDAIWERVKSGAVGEFEFAEGAMAPHPPSFYAKRNCYYGASSPSRGELAGRHEIGLDHILWGNNRKTLRHTMHDMPDVERRAILGENAAKLYRFDLAKLKPIVQRCGPTPEEVSLPLGPAEIPQNVHTNAFR